MKRFLLFALIFAALVVIPGGDVHAQTTAVVPAKSTSGAVLAPSDAQASQATTQAQAAYAKDQNNLQVDQNKVFDDSSNPTQEKIDQAQVAVDQADENYQQAVITANSSVGSGGALLNGDGQTQEDVVANASLVNSTLVKLNAAKAELSLAQGNTAAATAQAATAQQLAATSTAQAAQAQALATNDCSLTGGVSGLIGCVTGAVAAIALLILGMMGFLLGFIGSLFNWVVVYTVFEFGDYFGNSSGLLLAWGILRDVGNIVLLAAFIWVGIQIILDINSGATRKAIPRLLIVALLLNFSLFAAEAVIDTSNVLSAAMYNQSSQGTSTCVSIPVLTSGCTFTNTGISAKILTDAGVTSIFSTAGNFTKEITSVGQNPTQKMIVYIGLTIFISITLAVLLTAAIILLVRAIVLVFIMVLSPMGFAAMAIPGLEGMGKKWRDLLLSQSFFAPVYFLLLLVSLKIIEAVKTALLVSSSGATLYTALMSPTTSTTSVVIVFVLIIGFLIGAQMSAKQMGAIGATWATNAVNNVVRKTALAPVKVGGGWAYRHTAGEVFDKAGKGYASAIGAGRASKFAPLRVATRLFDNAAGASIEGSLGAAKNVKVLGAKSYDEKKKADKDRATHTLHAHEEANEAGVIDKGIKAPEGEAGDEARRNMNTALQKLSTKSIAELLSKQDADGKKKIGSVLAIDKFNKVLDEEGVDKEGLIEGRYGDKMARLHTLQEKINSTTGATEAEYKEVEDALSSLSVKEYETIAQNEGHFLDEVTNIVNPYNGAALMKEDVAEKLKDSNALTPDQRTKANGILRVTRLNNISKEIKASETTPARKAELIEEAQLQYKNMGKNVAKSDAEFMTNTDRGMGSLISQAHIEGLVADPDKVRDPEKRLDILRNIAANQDPASAGYRHINHYIQTNEAASTYFGGAHLP